VYRKALTNLLRYAQVLAGRSPPRDVAAALRTTEVIAGSGALLRDELPLGVRVTSGEIIGELVDELDHPVEQLRAPVAGELWAVRTFGSLDAGDIVCLIAHP
jgi:predicted deacylase